VPLTVFDTKGIPATRRERIEAAVEAGGKHVKDPYEAWITTDPFHGGVRVLVTGPLGFERSAQFAIDAEPYEITERVRATIGRVSPGRTFRPRSRLMPLYGTPQCKTWTILLNPV
jgi:hypothetical protein